MFFSMLVYVSDCVCIFLCLCVSVFQNERVNRELLERSLSSHVSACETHQQQLDVAQQQIDDLTQQLDTSQQVNDVICIC